MLASKDEPAVHRQDSMCVMEISGSRRKVVHDDCILDIYFREKRRGYILVPLSRGGNGAPQLHTDTCAYVHVMS